MTRDELTEIVQRSRSTTLFAQRMRQALGIPELRKCGYVRNRNNNGWKYRGAKRLMKQKHGVNLRQ